MFFRKRSEHPTEDELSGFLDGVLTPGRRAEVSRHLAGCEACSRGLEELRSVKALLAGLPQAAPSRSFTLGPEHAREVARPAAGRSPLAFAPAVALTLFVALIGVEMALPQGGVSFDRLTTANESASREEDGALQQQPAVARDSAGAAEAPMPAIAPPAPTTGESQGFSQPTSPAPGPLSDSADDAKGAAGSGGVASQPSVALEAEEDDDRTWLRLLQAGALTAFVGSLVVLWGRRRSSGERNR
jgi:hypothetical protein